MKNKRVKQMIADVAMQGRRLYWLGETTEVFLAKDAKTVQSEYYHEDDDPEDFPCCMVKTTWKDMWKTIRSEESLGGSLPDADGYHHIPLISFVKPFDPSYPAPQMFTSYN